MSSAADRPASIGAHRARVAAWYGPPASSPLLPLLSLRPLLPLSSLSSLSSLPVHVAAVAIPGAGARSVSCRAAAAPVFPPFPSLFLPS